MQSGKDSVWSTTSQRCKTHQQKEGWTVRQTDVIRTDGHGDGKYQHINQLVHHLIIQLYWRGKYHLSAQDIGLSRLFLLFQRDYENGHLTVIQSPHLLYLLISRLKLSSPEMEKPYHSVQHQVWLIDVWPSFLSSTYSSSPKASFLPFLPSFLYHAA